MGVFKWLRRERVTVTTHVSPEPTTPEGQCPQSATQIGTIRTDEYKRDLAEFQARRSSGTRELQVTPVKKKCGRHSLPVSCTDCAVDRDNTFNYEKKSAIKYKKKTHKRVRSAMSDENIYEGLPNIQFLFQNQVFMPGNMVATSTLSEPHKSRRSSRHRYFRPPDTDFLAHRHIDFKDEDHVDSPEFCKKSSLPFNLKNFLDGSRNVEEDVDDCKQAGNVNKKSSQHSPNGVSKLSNDNGDDKLWEVMSELKNFDQWADEQLQPRSPNTNTTKSEDSKSDTSAYGLPIASASNLDVTTDRSKVWNHGKWGVVPVQIKRLAGVSIEHVRKKQNTEINILRKCRHPNIILLMGLYPDIHNNVQIVCERCVDTLYGIIHVQGRILTAQTSVHYALDIANALVFLRMQGFVHSELSSESIMVTAHGAAKLADLGPCARMPKERQRQRKNYDLYSPEPQYASIEETNESNSADCEPLLTHRSSEAYLSSQAVPKDYQACSRSQRYRWQAPELFDPDEEGLVHACSRSDAYSLALVLWECCNAAVPWKTLSYEKLKELYLLWKTGIRLPQDGTYPGCLLALLQAALKVDRRERMDLEVMQDTLNNVKRNIDELEYIVIPAKLSKKKSDFSSMAWDTASPTDSDCLSPLNLQHKADIHKERDMSTDSSEKDCSKSDSPHYERIVKTRTDDTYAVTYAVPEKCFVSDEDQVDERLVLKYDHLPEKDFSSACSTPIAKIRARIKDIGTPGGLHRSDSTEYCSILTPNGTNFTPSDDKFKDQAERPATKLSRSFTPKSYKPLHIKVPDFNLDSIKDILKDQNGTERSSYNFDIKNYSLPSTPIARSNKLRKNAWLSGDLSLTRRSTEGLQDSKASSNEENQAKSPEDVPVSSENTSIEKENPIENNSFQEYEPKDCSPLSNGTQDSYTGLRATNIRPSSSPESPQPARSRSNSWSFRSAAERSKRPDEDLAGVNVKPLVAIHERWIYEANRKTGRSMSLPEDNKSLVQGVKPASHRVDTLQHSLPALAARRPARPFRAPADPAPYKNGPQWEQFCQARDNIAKSVNFSQRDPERFPTWKKDTEKSTFTEEPTPEPPKVQAKVDQATDTRGIEEFIRELIRKEFQHILQEMSDEGSTSTLRNEELLSRGVAHIVDNLRGEEGEARREGEAHREEGERADAQVKSFSRVKINGNNKPLLQITFSRSGENSLQVLDKCVNVTICEGARAEEAPPDDAPGNSLKRCQAFSAIQEARSTEDLYIDDDLSTQMQENFGGRVKLIPLHGSLHEILCEKEDECCLIKVKQENGCDTIYFRCDNSDTESRDALDGARAQDTVVFKRSIALVEERVRRRRAPVPAAAGVARETSMASVASMASMAGAANPPEPEPRRSRPKSEIFLQKISHETRVLSSSSPSLSTRDDRTDEVEVNIENVMCYQDSSSDECLKCQVENDDFELLERKIEEDLANSTLSSLTCGCLEKISEENLSVINEDLIEKD